MTTCRCNLPEPIVVDGTCMICRGERTSSGAEQLVAALASREVSKASPAPDHLLEPLIRYRV